ncbi:aminotransferase class I/II-fold pyridoxal phosphate-dependent enzyme [Pyramidobacter sp. CG50-2]|nr:aminotransferase class I/II-fold pyridoxal phosphate-dependent enzyme [Pyramidobacter sp. CG50-2]
MTAVRPCSAWRLSESGGYLGGFALKKFDHGGDVYSRDVDLDFSVNLNPLGMPPAVREALRAGVDSYAAYPDPHCRALRAALARALRVEPWQLLCGNGAADLIIRLCLARKPEKALLCAPTFSEYEKAALLSGARVKKFILREEDDFALGGGILGELTGSYAPDLFFLCNPNNPTGQLTCPALIGQIAAVCEKRGTLFVVDECFLPFTGAPSARPLLNAHPHLVIVDAFTKLYAMAGLRLGFMISADRRLVEKVAAFGQSWSVSAPAQTAGLAALSGDGEWTARTRAVVAAERAFVRAGLRELGFKVYDSAANYILFRSEKPLFEPMLAQGVLIRSCANYTGLDERYYRVGVKRRAENERLLAALRRALA